ncbi:MAG: tetratricopeptide repeat protein, partial [Micromonosporaceae bacterium]
LEEASETFGLVLAEHTANNHLPGVAVALNNLGHTYTQMGQPGRALELLTRALTLTRQIASPGFEAYTLHSIGEAHLAASEPDAALERFTEALALRRQLGERRLEATTLTFIGLAHLRRADPAGVARHFRQALALSRDLGDRDLEATILDHLDAGRRDAPSRGFEGDDRDRVGDGAGGRVEDLDVEPAPRLPR